MTLLEFILSAALHLAPGRDHTTIATAIAHVVETEGCLVAGSDCERRSAALATSIAFRESAFVLGAEGDCDKGGKNCRSLCFMQVQSTNRALLTDADACALEGYRRLRASLQACRGSIAMYAAGTCGSARGKSIDADRKRLAARILGGR